ncbi:MAG: helix-hairpin-helix domain-containing protein, partial [Bacillota bacterium]|nr:helix-hairpin-helix domain-containing protein [Bacillota bacterium]
MAILEGVVERITFHSPDDLYTVLRVDSDQCEELATVVGCFPAPRPGEELRFYGEWVHHPTYGRQFRAEAVEHLPPRTEEGLERYLGSGLIKGVGPATARSLVQHFGSSVLEVIEREPERLLEVPGIGKEKARRIAEAVAAQGRMREAMVFLQSHGLGPRQALRIYRAYGAETVQRVREDPYALAEEVFGIGFQTADRIARSLGVAETAPGRLRAGLLYLLRRAAEDGHVFLPAGQLLTEAARSLQVPYEAVEEALAGLEEERLVVRRRSRTGPPEEEPVYLAALYAAEQGVARRLLALVRAQLPPLPVNLEAVLRRFAAETGLSLSERQREAVACAARSGVFILTGGPGTGKTTVLRAIIYALEAAGLKVALASPTGRAAKRMAEAAGREASTVHRLLEYTPLEGGGGAFQRDEDNPLEAQAVIVDEASMLDLPLTYHLLRALR